jgi:uncharacterized protein involved in exopolysaccharide biosynthesis
MFDSLTIPQARPVVWLKRVLVFVIVALLTIEMVASYRAYFQVQGLELNAPVTLSAGTIVNTSVVMSGRTWVDIEVDLIQGRAFRETQLRSLNSCLGQRSVG